MIPPLPSLCDPVPLRGPRDRSFKVRAEGERGAPRTPDGARARAGARLLLAVLLAGAGACAPSPRPGHPQPSAWPGTRAPDGLLTRADLQAVVEAQARRETSPLVDWLGHPDADVRARAAFALASVQDTAAVPALLVAVRDADARVRADAAFALGQSGVAAAAAPLLAALRGESDPVVAELLLHALGRVGERPALEALAAQRVPRAQRAALGLALARFAVRGVHAPAATQRLLALLGDGDPQVRLAAAYAFARPTDPAFWRGSVAPLRHALDVRGVDDPSAAHLATALGRLREDEDRARLTRVATEALDWRTRVSGVRALAALAEGTGHPAVVERLDDPSHHVRRAAAEALGAADSLSPEVADRLTGWVAGRHDAAAVAALPGLLGAGREEAALAWLAAVPPDAPALRHAALRALGAGAGEGSLRVLEATLEGPDAAAAAAATDALAARWRATGSAERAGVFYGALRRALLREDAAGVGAAAGALADTLFQPLGAVELLLSAYADLEGSERVAARVAVLAALGRSGSPLARPLLDDVRRGADPVLAAAAVAALAALDGAPAPEGAAGERVRTTVDWPALWALGRHPLLVLETGRGTLTLRLDTEQAPLTVQTVSALAAAGRYDGVPFHRVVPNFVIQGGDVGRGDGAGGLGFAIPSEFTRLPYRRGTAGMASAGKDTEGSQYFVTHSMQPHLDGAYTAFGAVERGMEVVDRIRPGDRVLRARIVPGRP